MRPPRWMALCLGLTSAIAGCKGDVRKAALEAKREAIAASSVKDASTVVDTATTTPEQLWRTYQAAHVGATAANAIETGARIWPLLSASAQQAVIASIASTTAGMTVKVAISPQDLAFKILGETAAVRASFIAAATLEAQPAGTTAATSLRLTKPGAPPLELAAVRIDGLWRLDFGPGLIPTDLEVFHPSAGSDHPVGLASVEAVAARWLEILAKGSGFDAYNLMSSAMRKRLLAMVASVGGSGAEDVARIFEKTIVDRRTRGTTVVSSAIEDRATDHATMVLTYSDGKSERFTAVQVDGVWWLEMPM